MHRSQYVIIGLTEYGIRTAIELAKTGASILIVKTSEEEFSESFTSFARSVLNEEAYTFSLSLERFKNISETFNHLVKYRKQLGKYISKRIKKERESIEAVLSNTENITILEGEATFSSKTLLQVTNTSETTHVKFKTAILADSADPVITLPHGISTEGVLTKNNVYLFEEIPSTLLLIGISFETLDVARIYSQLGVKVIILDERSKNTALRIADRTGLNYILSSLLKQQVEIHYDSIITGARKKRKYYGITTLNNEFSVSHIYAPMHGYEYDDEHSISTLGGEITKHGVRANTYGRVDNTNHVFVFGTSQKGATHDRIISQIDAFVSQRINANKKKNNISQLVGQYNEHIQPSPVSKKEVGFNWVQIGLSEFEAFTKHGPTVKVFSAKDPITNSLVKFIYKNTTNTLLGAVLAGREGMKLEAACIQTIHKKHPVDTFIQSIRTWYNWM